MVHVRNSDPHVQLKLTVGGFHLNGNISDSIGQSQTRPRPLVFNLSISATGTTVLSEARARHTGCTLFSSIIQTTNNPQLPVLLPTSPVASLVEGSLPDLPQRALQ